MYAIFIKECKLSKWQMGLNELVFMSFENIVNRHRDKNLCTYFRGTK